MTSVQLGTPPTHGGTIFCDFAVHRASNLSIFYSDLTNRARFILEEIVISVAEIVISVVEIVISVVEITISVVEIAISV